MAFRGESRAEKTPNVWALYRPAITVKAHELHFVHMIYRTPRLISFSVVIVMRMCFRIGFEIGLFSEPERENIMKNSNCNGCAIWSRVRPRFIFDHRVQESLCCTQNVERTVLRGQISSRGVIVFRFLALWNASVRNIICCGVECAIRRCVRRGVFRCIISCNPDTAHIRKLDFAW